jgi:hypothetical protein
MGFLRPAMISAFGKRSAARRRRLEEATMGEVAYRSEVRVERVKGPLRRAYLPAEKEPVLFSTHGAVAAHYKAQPGTYEPHATTLDYVVAATAG